MVHLPAPTIDIDDGSGTATITNTTAHGQSDGVSLFYTLDGSLPAFNTDRTPADGTLLYHPSSKPTVPAGKTIKVYIPLEDETFLWWSEEKRDMVPLPGKYELLYGGSSDQLKSVKYVY